MKKRVLSLLCAAALLCALPGCGKNDKNLQEGKEQLAAEVPAVTLDEVRLISFSDVPGRSIYRDAIAYTVHLGILTGKEDGSFGPEDMMTRGETALALYRLSGGGEPEGESPFADVPFGRYAQAAVWCTETGVLPAVTEESFEPNTPMTRRELASALFRAAGHLGYSREATGDLSAYEDADKVPEHEAEAVSWALERGCYTAVVDGVIRPDIAVSRAQLAQALTGLLSAGGDDLAAEILSATPHRTDTSDARENHEAIQLAVDAAAKKYGAAGVQVAVVENGVVADTFAYGWAVKNTEPMTAHHKMRVASISKVLVGMTAMLLREEGVIDLDADISEYWGVTVKNPSHPETPVTIRSMLSHTSSIVNAGDDESRSGASVCSRLQNGFFSAAVPGDIGYWSYNNYAYAALGMTLELASGRLVDETLSPRLYVPMDIDAAFAAGDIQNTDMLAALYQNDGSMSRSVSAQQNMHNNPTPGATGKYFAGGLTVSAADLGKIAALLSQDGCYEGVRYLSRDSVELMETCYPEAVPGGSYQALPLRYHEDIYGRDGVYYHTGSAYGVFNCFSYDPETGDGVVVLTTGASGAKDEWGIYKICAAINEAVYSLLDDRPAAERATEAEPTEPTEPTIKADPEEPTEIAAESGTEAPTEPVTEPAAEAGTEAVIVVEIPTEVTEALPTEIPAESEAEAPTEAVLKPVTEPKNGMEKMNEVLNEE